MLAVRDYVGKRRDSQQERYLAQELRTWPEDKRANFVSDWLRPEYRSKPGFMAGFDLIKMAGLQNKQLLQKLLSDGLEQADASDVRWWLENLTPALGRAGVTSVLVRIAAKCPAVIEAALYWLKRLGWAADQIERIRAARAS